MKILWRIKRVATKPLSSRSHMDWQGTDQGELLCDIPNVAIQSDEMDNSASSHAQSRLRTFLGMIAGRITMKLIANWESHRRKPQP